MPASLDAKHFRLPVPTEHPLVILAFETMQRTAGTFKARHPALTVEVLFERAKDAPSNLLGLMSADTTMKARSILVSDGNRIKGTRKKAVLFS